MEQNVCVEENIPNYAKCMKIKTDLCIRRKRIYYVAYPYMLCNVPFFLLFLSISHICRGSDFA